MGTIVTEQAGKEYTLVQSNKGMRVEYNGEEVFRHWPDDPEFLVFGEEIGVSAPTNVVDVNSVEELQQAIEDAPEGSVFRLMPADYQFTVE